MPLFSIVIPTRNRAYLLRYSLQSALQQTFDDFEILVSNNNCSDDTDQVVEELRTSRVRYVHTDKTLSMPDHWDFVLSHATGDYITYLCDDDAFCPNLLEKAESELTKGNFPLLTWNIARYIHPTWDIQEERNRIQLYGPFSGEAVYRNSRSDLKDFFAFKDHHCHPKMLNSLCARNVLQDIKRRLGRVFLPICPDYTFCAAALSLTEEYVFIDFPLALVGSARESIGSSYYYRRGKPVEEFKRELNEDNLLAHIPLKSPVVANYVAESLLRVKEKMGEDMNEIQLDWERYFTTCYSHIELLSRYGVDVTEDKEEFLTILDHQRDPLRTNVREYIWPSPVPDQRRGITGHLRRGVRRVINQSQALSRLESRIRYGNTSLEKADKTVPYHQRWPIILSGEDNNFTNILECSKELEDIFKRLQIFESADVAFVV